MSDEHFRSKQDLEARDKAGICQNCIDDWELVDVSKILIPEEVS